VYFSDNDTPSSSREWRRDSASDARDNGISRQTLLVDRHWISTRKEVSIATLLDAKLER